jgi:hypothetical protein
VPGNQPFTEPTTTRDSAERNRIVKWYHGEILARCKVTRVEYGAIATPNGEGGLSFCCCHSCELHIIAYRTQGHSRLFPSPVWPLVCCMLSTVQVFMPLFSVRSRWLRVAPEHTHASIPPSTVGTCPSFTVSPTQNLLHVILTCHPTTATALPPPPQAASTPVQPFLPAYMFSHTALSRPHTQPPSSPSSSQARHFSVTPGPGMVIDMPSPPVLPTYYWDHTVGTAHTIEHITPLLVFCTCHSSMPMQNSPSPLVACVPS